MWGPGDDRPVAEERRRRRRIEDTLVGLAYAVVATDAFVAAWSLIAGNPWDWGRFSTFFIVAVVSSVASSIGEALARGSATSSTSGDEGDETAQAMRTGCLPPDADPDIWRARIARHVRRAHLSGAVLAGLCVASAVLTAAAAHLNGDDDPVLWGLSVMTLAFVAPLLWLVARVRQREQRLLERL